MKDEFPTIQGRCEPLTAYRNDAGAGYTCGRVINKLTQKLYIAVNCDDMTYERIIKIFSKSSK